MKAGTTREDRRGSSLTICFSRRQASTTQVGMRSEMLVTWAGALTCPRLCTRRSLLDVPADDQETIMRYLDPQQTGFIDYRSFLRTCFGTWQQQRPRSCKQAHVLSLPAQV